MDSEFRQVSSHRYGWWKITPIRFFLQTAWINKKVALHFQYTSWIAWKALANISKTCQQRRPILSNFVKIWWLYVFWVNCYTYYFVDVCSLISSTCSLKGDDFNWYPMYASSNQFDALWDMNFLCWNFDPEAKYHHPICTAASIALILWV